MRRITILGSFSGRNKGDLAILRSELIQLKTRAEKEHLKDKPLRDKPLRGKLTVYIFTKDVSQIREYLSDLITDVKNNKGISIKILRGFTSYIGPKTLPVLAKSDKVVIGGGGIFFDTRLFNITFNHLLNLFIVTLWLKLLGKQVMIFAVGCSNLNSRLARWMTKVVLNNAEIVSARDELSKRIFSECADKEIILGAEPAFLLEPKRTERAEKIVQSWPSGRKILLCLSELMFIKKSVADPQNTLMQFLNHVSEFAKQNGYTILTYTNYTNQSFASKTAKLCGESARTMLEGDNHLLPEELIYLFSKFDFVITAQMHVAIFAYIAGVALMNLIYDDKVEEFNKLVGNQNYLYLAEMDDGPKVAKTLSITAAGEAMPRKASVQAGSEKLVELLNEFVWS
jgi:polysaccharide pyruvyl transferase WcaK-like protein